MTSIDTIKIILAGFTTLLVVLLIGNVVNELTHREPLEQPAYAVIVSDEPEQADASAEAAPELEPVTPLLASADPAAGEKASKRCATCHTFNEGGANKIGPNLWGTVGNPKAAADGYDYSDALRELGGSWTYDDLNAFLAKPKEYLPGTKMNFAGVKSVEDRAAIIAYMRQQAATPAPLPSE